MLKIHFINVAEGDATLLELFDGAGVTRVLIDAGRQNIEEDAASVHLTAAEYLKKNRITYIDLMVMTHLHVDHSAGLTDVLECAKIGKFCCSYFPKDKTLRTVEHPDAQHNVAELEQDLNRYAQNLVTMESRDGTEFHLCERDETVFDAGGFSVSVVTADATSVAGQNLIYDAMMDNVPLTEDIRYWASEARNPNSLRVDVQYAGRRIRIDGDYLVSGAERESLPKCDILKVSHHGDRKSANANTVRMLAPEHAVISCKREYVPRKDRPSKNVAELFRSVGSRVYYTDSFAEEGHSVILRAAVVFTVKEDGIVLAPEEN